MYKIQFLHNIIQLKVCSYSMPELFLEVLFEKGCWPLPHPALKVNNNIVSDDYGRRHKSLMIYFWKVVELMMVSLHYLMPNVMQINTLSSIVIRKKDIDDLCLTH